MRSHLLNLALYSLAIGVLFSVFMREGGRERVRFSLALAGSMVGIAIAVGWILYFLAR